MKGMLIYGPLTMSRVIWGPFVTHSDYLARCTKRQIAAAITVSGACLENQNVSDDCSPALRYSRPILDWNPWLSATITVFAPERRIFILFIECLELRGHATIVRCHVRYPGNRRSHEVTAALKQNEKKNVTKHKHNCD